jgi:hypothetical protein
LSSEKIDEALKHARKEKTQDGYNAALNRFTAWCAQFYDEHDIVKKVIFEAEENEHRLTFDAAKLAKSFEENMNVYFNYTLSYQKRMNSKQKSGLALATLKSYELHLPTFS